MEKLAAYLKATNMTQSAFADAIGVRQPTVNRWLNNQGKPSWDKAAQIEALTNGAVPVSVWAAAHKSGAAA